MIRFVLIIGVGLLAANVAQAAPNTCKTTCAAINNNIPVCNLQLPYVPNSKKGPQCASNKGNQRAIARAKRRLATVATSIQNALAIAPPGLQQCLCSLKQIYVTTDPMYGNWGKWEGRGNGNSSIALYTTTLNTTLPALMNQQLTGLGISNSAGQYSDNNYANSGTLAVLYALAHEMGHMAFRRDYTYLSGCGEGNGIVPLQSFLMKSWTDAQQNWQDWVDVKKRPWTYFGDTSFGVRDPAIPDPSNASSADLKMIYTSTVASTVVTAFAAANPEEDFVESYSLEAINLAANNNYTLSIVDPYPNGTSYPVNQGRNSLSSKFTCVDSILKTPP